MIDALAFMLCVLMGLMGLCLAFALLILAGGAACLGYRHAGIRAYGRGVHLAAHGLLYDPALPAVAQASQVKPVAV